LLTIKDTIPSNAGQYLVRLNQEMTFQKRIPKGEYKDYLDLSQSLVKLHLLPSSGFTQPQMDIAKAIEQSSRILASCYI
jgi:hypothetical protein